MKNLLKLSSFLSLLLFFSSAVHSQDIEYSEHRYRYQGASFNLSLSPVETALKRCSRYGGLYRLRAMDASNYGYPNYFVLCNEVHFPNEISVTTYCGDGWRKSNDSCYRFKSDVEHGTDSGEPSCEAGVANPVNLTTGRKFQRETDYISASNPLLRFERFYNTHPYAINRPGEPIKLSIHNYSSTWTHTFSSYIKILEDPINVGTKYLTVLRPTGEVESFTQTGNVITRRATNSGTDRLRLEGGVYKYLPDGNTVEYYDLAGRFLKRVRGRYEVSAVYGVDGELAQIITPEGSTLTFSKAVNTVLVDTGEEEPFEHNTALLSAVTLPDGSQIQYEQDQSESPIERLALTKVIYPDLTERRYFYESYRRLLSSIEDEKGVIYSQWTYDSAGLAVSSSLADNVDTYTFSYNGGDTIVTNPLGLETTYTRRTFAGKSRIKSVDSAATPLCEAAAQSYEYDSKGNRISATDWEGNVTSYSYNALNQRIAITEADGSGEQRITTFEWHPEFNLPVRIVYPHKTVDYVYDEMGNTTQRTETDAITAEVRVWSYQYDAQFRLIQLDGPRDDVADTTTLTYYNCNTGSECGQIASVTNGLGQSFAFSEYNAHGQPITILDANNVATSITYDLRQRISGISHAGSQQNLSYDATGNIIKVAWADGTEVNYSWDDANRLIAIYDAQNNRIEWTLDAAGNRLTESIKDPAGSLRKSQSRTYDEMSRLVGTLMSHGGAEQFAYDKNSNLTSATDASNRTTAHNYDALDRIIQSTDANQGVTQYSYDTQNNVTSVTDPEGVSTTYTYNGFGDLITENSADAGASTYTYDNAGNVKTKTDARGVTANYSYDALNRLTSISYPDSAENINYTYDQGVNAIGRLSGISDQSGGISFSYDSRGNVTQTTYTIGANNYTVSYSYNAADRLTGMTYPGGRSINYTYDNSGRIESVSSTHNGVTESLASNIGRLPFGPLESLTLGNGINRSRSYDQDYRITNITDGAVLDRNYAFSSVNNITAITDSLNAGQSQLFDYDALDRLSFATGGYGEQSFTYDGIGNRLSLETTQGGTTQTQTYQYDANSHRLNAIVGERSFTYDAVGNTINNGNAAFTYNNRNRMSSATANGVTTSYEINALGQRVRKSSAVGETQFIYDLSGRLIAEADANGSVKVEYAYLDGEPLSMWRDDDETPPPPPPEADFAFSSSGSSTQGKWQVFQFDVTAGELVEAEVTWDDPTADVRIFLRDESRVQVAKDTDGGLPATVSTVAQSSGRWSIGVSIRSGSVNYDVLVNITSDEVEPPDPVADYVFSSSGSTTQGKWQVFQFDVTAGELVEAEVTWDDPTADVRIFLRDETRTQVAKDTDGGLPATVSTVAQSSGRWSIGVSIRSGSVDYDVLVNTTTDEVEPPDPVTSYTFSSSGSPTQGKWQVFPFEINAGESVDVDVTWDDPAGTIRIFLRDETNSQVARDRDGGLPAMLSTVAQSSGTWSLGVSVISGSVNYDVQVNAQGGQ